MTLHPLPDTIEELEEQLYALTDGAEINGKRLFMALQSAKFHLEQWQKTYSNGGTCDYIVSMNQKQFRKFCEQSIIKTEIYDKAEKNTPKH